MLDNSQHGHRTLYVYYKVPSAKRDYYLSAVKKMRGVISELYPTFTPSHQQRPELDKDSHELWMEIYNDIPKDTIQEFSASLNKLAEHHGMPSERRLEIFIPLLTG